MEGLEEGLTRKILRVYLASSTGRVEGRLGRVVGLGEEGLGFEKWRSGGCVKEGGRWEVMLVLDMMRYVRFVVSLEGHV
jgi:hypothetical protein